MRPYDYNWQLLIDIVLRTAGSVFESDMVQKIHVLSNTQTYVKPDPQRLPRFILNT